MKKHIVTIAGKPASGKSTTSKLLAARLGYDHFSSGDLFRQISKEQGLDILQANLTAEQNSAIDHTVDQRLRDIGANEENKIIDSRMAWHWMPDSFKVYLNLDLRTAAQRILDNIDAGRAEHEIIPKDADEYAAVLQQRLESETRRYRKLYEVNPYDLDNYDLVVDTAKYLPEQAVTMIQQAFEKWLAEG